MGRPKNSMNQTCYRFKVVLEEKHTMCRSLKEVAELLSVGVATVSRHLKNPEKKLRKYRKTHLEISRINLPIYGGKILIKY
tara:strand:+ start:2387 stop:2629 length:243 start_codon:yes stop_codon:yes gene_type:complete